MTWAVLAIIGLGIALIAPYDSFLQAVGFWLTVISVAWRIWPQKIEGWGRTVWGVGKAASITTGVLLAIAFRLLIVLALIYGLVRFIHWAWYA